MAISPQVPFVLSAAGFTDVGRVRHNNEDYLGYHLPAATGENAHLGALFVVCDGVGGSVSGEVASKHAFQRILNDYYQGIASLSPLERLVQAIEHANAEIYSQNAGQPNHRKMTTTVVASAIVGDQAFIAHVGDSRAYLLRSGMLNQLTRDHSWVAEMIRAGELSAEEAKSHPWRNRITRALGLEERVDVETQTVSLQAADVMVLCSDGLTRHVSDEEIAAGVSGRPLRQAARDLVNLANARGGEDNISVLLIGVNPPSSVPASKRQRGAPIGEKGKSDRIKVAAVLSGLALIIFLAIGAAIYTQTDWIRRQDQGGTPTVALPAVGGASPTVTPTKVLLPSPQLVATGVGGASSTPEPLIFITPTSTVRATLTPTGTATPTATEAAANPPTPTSPPAEERERPAPTDTPGKERVTIPPTVKAIIETVVPTPPSIPTVGT